MDVEGGRCGQFQGSVPPLVWGGTGKPESVQLVSEPRVNMERECSHYIATLVHCLMFAFVCIEFVATFW